MHAFGSPLSPFTIACSNYEDQSNMILDSLCIIYMTDKLSNMFTNQECVTVHLLVSKK